MYAPALTSSFACSAVAPVAWDKRMSGPRRPQEMAFSITRNPTFSNIKRTLTLECRNIYVMTGDEFDPPCTKVFKMLRNDVLRQPPVIPCHTNFNPSIAVRVLFDELSQLLGVPTWNDICLRNEVDIRIVLVPGYNARMRAVAKETTKAGGD